MAILKTLRNFNFGLILVTLIICILGKQIAEPADSLSDNSPSTFSPLIIIDTIPQPDAGIIDSTRVHDDTSFGILIQAEHGIDLSDSDSIRFFISDGEFDLYERNLNSSAVRVVEIGNDSSPATLVWALYDRSLEPMLPPVYALDAIVQIFVDVEDIYKNEVPVTAGHFKFKIESDGEQAHAYNHLPESVSLNIENTVGIHDAGIEIISGVLIGARILYSADEPLLPAFGPVDEVESLVLNGEHAVGAPLNLMPHTVFNHPIKLFIPFPEGTDVTDVDIYYHNGIQWQVACDADGNILTGGEGWMVPGSRVNHPHKFPPQIEIDVYHFSAAQAVVSQTSSAAGNTQYNKSGSGATVYVTCFIDSAASGSKSPIILFGLLVPMMFAKLILRIFHGKDLKRGIRKKDRG